MKAVAVRYLLKFFVMLAVLVCMASAAVAWSIADGMAAYDDKDDRRPYGIWFALAVEGSPSIAQKPQNLQYVASKESAIENPLRPADTSSPRDTIVSFNSNIQNSMLSWRAGEFKDKVIVPARRALSTLNFGYEPNDRQQAQQFDTALMLKELLDRVGLPALDAIPGDDDLADRKKPLLFWRLPETNIEIGLVQEGPRKGEYLFTPATLARLEKDFELARHVPYRNSALIGVYDEFTSSPGLIFPRSLANLLPNWSMIRVFNKTIWQWALLILAVAMTFMLVRCFVFFGRLWDRRAKDWTPFAKIGTAAGIFASIVVIRFADTILIFGGKFYGSIGETISILASCLIYLGIGWLIILLSEFILLRLNDSERLRKSGLDLQLSQALVRLGTAGLLVGLFVYAVDSFGVPLGPVLAGLGIGGAAIAIAVRPTLENVIAGLTLYIDKPVRIGDFCEFSDNFGTVEDIGLQYTRIRKLDDSLVSLPNAVLAQRELTNFGWLRRRLFQATIKLRVDTTAEQIKAITKGARRRLLQNPLVDSDRFFVRFRKFGDYSLNIEIRAYIDKLEWLEFMEVSEQLNLEVLTVVSECGATLAVPEP